MKHYEAVVEILRQAREARQWTDEAVASDLCTQLGLDPEGEAKKATVVKSDDAPAPDAGPKPSTNPLDMAPGTLEPNLPPVPAPPSDVSEADKSAQDASVVDKGETQDAGKPSTRASFSGVASSDDDKDSSKDSKKK